jgi:hypothetical protein
MRRTFSAVLLVGLGVSVAYADEKPTPPPSRLTTLTPEDDWRLAKLESTKPQKIGILTCFPNKGGGYTFLEGKRIAFYALPYLPTTYQTDCVEWFTETMPNGQQIRRGRPTRNNLFTIGTSKMPFGSQSFYHGRMKDTLTTGVRQREDVPIGKLSRDTSDGKFRLSVMAEDNETRLKLKSIMPVLETAPKPIPLSVP